MRWLPATSISSPTTKPSAVALLPLLSRRKPRATIRSKRRFARAARFEAGSKVWAGVHGKSLILAHIGTEPLEAGLNILGAHIDSPRLDLKQNPVYENNGFAFLDTHYYGGIKHYQWVTLPLALHGVVAKTDGTVVDVNVGDDAGDPVFCVTDLLPHLGNQQMSKKGSEVVEGENLDVLIGNRPPGGRARRRRFRRGKRSR